MKTITHDSLPPDLTKSEKQAKPRQESDEVDATVWVMIAVLLALVLAFGYLFWNKF
jgi:hypothetical protein